MRKGIIPMVVATGIIVFICYCVSSPAVFLSGSFVGSYSSDGTDNNSWIAINPEGNTFHYTNNNNLCYIKGHFEEVSENTFSLICDKATDKEIIPDQELVSQYRDHAFTVQINNHPVAFQKIAETPVTIADEFYK